MGKPQQGDFWEEIINGLTGPFPEIGTEPPTLEFNQPAEEKEIKKDVKTFNGIDPDSTGNFSKLTMEVFFFFDNESNKYYMMRKERMWDYGEMTLEKAIEIVNKGRKRKD